MKTSMIKSTLLAMLFAVGTMSVFTACKDDDDNNTVKDTVVFGTPSFSATTLKAEADVADGKITIPYQKALGSEEYTMKVAISGAGAAGITVADKSVKLTSGSGNIELAVTGKPTAAGAVTFSLSGIAGLTKNTIDATVTAADAKLAFGTPTFTATKIQAAKAIEGGKISIPYTDAKGTEQYTISVAATGAGSAGINAITGISKTLTAGNGNIELDITGTPTAAGAVTFTISGVIGLTTTTVASTVAATTLSFGTPTFAATKIQATKAIEGGKISIPYTNAVGTEQYTISVAATGAGSAGINAVSNVSKTLTAGNGNIVLDITGTPTTAGAVTFIISGIAALAKNTATATVEEAPAPAGFAVGDYYPAGATKDNAVGVVFWIDPDDAFKGKIVSLNNSGEYPEWGTENIVTGATSDDNGTLNTTTVTNLDTYTAEKYPAVAVCVAKGTGWYLPAKNEIRAMYNWWNTNPTANNALITNAGGESLIDKIFWSSTEYNNNQAWSIAFEDGNIGFNDKISTFVVRCIKPVQLDL